MFKRISFSVLLVCSVLFVQAQSFNKTQANPKQDSIKKSELLKSIGNGYFPTKYFDADLRYLIKFNQYEGVRTGLGGTTNKRFSEKFKLNGYTVYGFRDHRFKYSIGGCIRLDEKSNTWANLSYTDDLQETGSTKFLTDTRFFQFFEPRLLNIDLFHRHITKALSIGYQIHPKLKGETEFSLSNINPTYGYSYLLNNTEISSYDLSLGVMAFQWSPFSKFEASREGTKKTKEGYPKFTFQFTKNFQNVFKNDLKFSKFDFRTFYKIGNENDAFSEITVVSGIANGNIPITHLYHAYPNNINKEKVLQRFSVAGINSFETMYFNEFFSDRFATIQFKHFLKPFQISERFKPQLVLISRYAIGDMKHPERHQNMTFNLLNKGYTESGFELNKLLFGFGLSFTYRYGAYHLPQIDDNVAFKFTFNVSL